MTRFWLLAAYGITCALLGAIWQQHDAAAWAAQARLRYQYEAMPKPWVTPCAR